MLKDHMISARAFRLLLILGSIASMVMYVERMLIPAIPMIIDEFDISYSIASWILAIYLITGAISTPILGRLSDLYGKKKILLILLIIYSIAISLGGFVYDIYSLLIIRAIQGLGIAMFPIALNIVRTEFARDKVAVGQGFIISMFALGTVIGLVLGANIIALFGWRFTYFSIMPIVMLLTFLISRLDIKDKAYQRKRIDYIGALLLAISIASFLLTLTYLDDNSIPYLLAIISIVSFISFIVFESKNEDPLVNFIIFKGALLPANLIVMILGFCMFLTFQTIPILISSPEPYGLGGDVLDIAYAQLPFALILLVFAPLSGFIIVRIGSIKAVISGISIVIIGFMTLFSYHSSLIELMIGLAIIGIGLALINVSITNIIALMTDKNYLGIGFGMHTLVRVIGASTGPVVAGVVMQMYAIDKYPSSISYNYIFLLAISASISMLALSILLKRKVMMSNDKV